jgi:predicted PurR-regulated permease PerM
MRQNGDSSRDLPRTILSVGAIGALIVATVWIVRPFLSAFLWAVMIVISTWPLLIRLQARLWGKRGMAAAVMTFALLLVLVVPLGFSVGALVGNIDSIVTWVSSLNKLEVPPPPVWLDRIPLAGPKALAVWQSLASEGPGGAAARMLPYASRFIRWFAAQIGGIGAMILQFLMTVVMCAVLYMKGDATARGVRKFARRLAGSNGDRAALLAANSIRGVAMGVVGTAIVQTLIAGTGFALSLTPGTLLLSAAVLILCLAQLGPMPVMLPAAAWKFYTGSTFSGWILLAFMLAASTTDNILRPILIRKGADLPLLLIFTGVIGGMISLGIIGIFVGPVILAVTYTLLQEWVEHRSEPDADVASDVAVK